MINEDFVSHKGEKKLKKPGFDYQGRGMTREKRAKVYAEDAVCNALWSDIEFQSDATMAVCDFAQAYLQGAKDAEDNPAWRMCEDELPESGTQCWCATSDGKEIIARFNGAYWRYSGTSKKDIIAWLPLPKFKV